MGNAAQLNSVGVHDRFVSWLLFAFVGVLGLNVGGALLATLVIFPVWSASPEAALEWRVPVNEASFFVVVSPVVLVLAVVVLVVSWWVAPEVRLWMRVAAALYLVFFVATMAFFVPGQAVLQGTAAVDIPPAEHSALLRQWVRSNWVRQGVGLVAFGSALHALGLAYSARRARIPRAYLPREEART